MIGHSIANRYEVLQELEVGPVWTLYKARDRVAGRFVSMRVLAPEIAGEQGVIEEIKLNVQRLARVTHPALEKVLSFEDNGDVWYLLSEHNAGSALEDRIKRLSSYSVPVAVGTVIEAGEAIKALHDGQIVHGDLSGRSIYATATEGVKVTMPGFWKAYGHSSKAAVRVLKAMAPYLAPEVSAGAMPSVQSDIYALGVVLWQLLAGRLPYPGDSPAAIAAKHLQAPYPSLRGVMASVPMPLDEIVRKCMAKRPEDRYQSVQMVVDDLRSLLDALRFGKPLTWPLAAASKVTTPRAVAPQMNVANPKPRTGPGDLTQPEAPQQMRQKDTTDGLPTYITTIGYVLFLAVVVVGCAYAYFNFNKPKTVLVPNEIGKRYDDAKKDLDALNLDMHQVGKKMSDKYPAGVIIAMRPAPGNETRSYSFVDVTVSAGNEHVQVPNLHGKSLSDAKGLLDKMNLEISQDFQYVPDPNLDKDFVVNQVPAAGKEVERFTKIKLIIANGDKSTPEPTGPYKLYRVRVPIPAGDNPVQVRITKTDEQSADQVVYDQKQDPGQTITQDIKGYGGEVKFDIFLDGQLLKSITMTAPDSGAKKSSHSGDNGDNGDKTDNGDNG